MEHLSLERIWEDKLSEQAKRISISFVPAHGIPVDRLFLSKVSRLELSEVNIGLLDLQDHKLITLYMEDRDGVGVKRFTLKGKYWDFVFAWVDKYGDV